jgi:serine/threonine protein kinase
MVPASSPSPGPVAVYEPLFEGTPYRPLQRLRAGGMGEVFIVQHQQTKRRLVVKLIHERLTRDPRLVERLRVEAQALGKLQHQHIVKIIDFDETRAGRPFIAMELLEGRTLAEELAERGKLPVLEAVLFASDVLSGLGAAHKIGIVHRDIKPDNLFVCRRADGSRYIKVLDFGVARVMPDSAVEPLPHDMRTRTGVVVGTPRWVSPEGAVGQHVDPRADLYAVGLVLYVMLVGRGPFDHFEGDQIVLSAHAVEDPDPPSRFADEPVPPELDQALLKALAKDANQRFQTAEEFRAFLLQVSELLRRPSGWMQTTAFDANELRRVAAEGKLAASERALPDPEVPRQPVHPGSPNVAPEREPERREPQKEARSESRHDPAVRLSRPPAVHDPWRPIVLVVVFVACAAVAAFAALGLLSLLQGRP